MDKTHSLKALIYTENPEKQTLKTYHRDFLKVYIIVNKRFLISFFYIFDIERLRSSNKFFVKFFEVHLLYRGHIKIGTQSSK